jgi:hypothetical protein
MDTKVKPFVFVSSVSFVFTQAHEEIRRYH